MHTPTEKETDLFETQQDQKAYYNWSVNVDELSHPLLSRNIDKDKYSNRYIQYV